MRIYFVELFIKGEAHTIERWVRARHHEEAYHQAVLLAAIDDGLVADARVAPAERRHL